MTRDEIRLRITNYFRSQIPLMADHSRRINIQMGFIRELFQEEVQKLPGYRHDEVYSICREIVQEMINCGWLYPGTPGDPNSSFPWLTITEFGKEAVMAEQWLPYDPDGYISALKAQVPDLDDVTLKYISEAVQTYHRRNLLSATITLGVASENLVLNLIDAYSDWIPDQKRAAGFKKRILDRWISSQYEEFKKEFPQDRKTLPKDIIDNVDTYLDGIFNFVRVSRNTAGHPTGISSSAKTLFANLQIFSEYSSSIFRLMRYFIENRTQPLP